MTNRAGVLCTLKRFLKRNRLFVTVLLAISAVLYFTVGFPALTSTQQTLSYGASSDTLEEVCENYFNSLIHHQDGQWHTDFTTYDNNEISTSVERIRLYGQCYLRNNFTPRSFDLTQIEQRLFPIFNAKELTLKNKGKRETASMFSNYGSGRGIVLSLGVMQMQDFGRLLAALGAIGNTLPIEVVHKGELSSKRMLDTIELAKKASLPQTLTFKNVEDYIDPQHYVKFSRFANKWLPALFSSFEEVIIMDADVIPAIKPEALFDLEGYKSTGSYLFRDRAVSDEILPSKIMRLYRDLLPSKREVEKFGLPSPPEGRSRLEFLTGHYHTVESGIVLMNRRKFFPGLLMGLALQLWKPTSNALWGDKELFWLGQSIAGEERYFVHPLSAGSIGLLRTLDKKIITDPKERETVKNSMVCSIQVAHFSEQHELLWLNSGLLNCKFGSWFIDFGKYFKDDFSSIEEMQKYYLQPVDVNAAIIAPHFKKPLFNWWKKMNIGFQKNREMGCSGYVWCAYDNPSDGHPGQKILLTDEQIERFNAVKKAWIDAS